MKNLTVAQLITYATYIVAGASLLRVILHHLRGALVIWIAFDAASPSRFWRFYEKLEATTAYVAIALGKYARKGEGQLMVLPADRDVVNRELEQLGAEEDTKTTQPLS